MQIALLLFSILIYVLTFWLGLYLLRRDVMDPRLRWTGVGLLLYAVIIGVVVIQFGRTANDHTAWPTPVASSCKPVRICP